MRIKISNNELQNYLEIPTTNFPKYTTLLLNTANRISQGTRPHTVGKVTELIQEFPGKNYSNWVDWYLQKYPNAIEDATNKVYAMIENYKNAISLIDRDMVKKWVTDLVLTKTFIGLMFQEAIIKKISEVKGLSYRLANSQEESQGIDGFIGDEPVSIKPSSYRSEQELIETINANIIFYDKLKDGIAIEIDNI